MKRRSDPDVAAVIVTYYPNLPKLHALIDSIRPQVRRVVIVDNASPVDIEGWLASSLQPGTLDLIRLPANLGVAAGHNLGIRRAAEMGCDFVALFDQDSLPQEDFVDQMMAAYDTCRAQGKKVGVCGPSFHDPRFDEPHSFIFLKGWRIHRVSKPEAKDVIATEASYLIASGSFIPLSVIKDVGGLDESLFIDYVDIEWCLRLSHHGYACLGVWRARMEHSLGDAPLYMFKRKRAMPLHSPLRHYYYFRNALLLYKRSYVPLQWVINDALRLARKFAFYSLFAPRRLEHLRMMSLGLWHGFLGRSGSFERACRR